MTRTEPNVVLVHCHDLGRHLGCYGRGVDTPELDALAEEGAVFENHFVTAPQCSPSRGSLHTGLFPHRNCLMGLAHGSWTLDDDVRTLGEHLREAGYETHLFGLQHITNDPQRIGFEHNHSEGNLSPAASPEIHEVNRASEVSDTVEVFLEKDAYTTPFFAAIGFFEAHRIEVNDHFGFDDGPYEPSDPDEVAVPRFLDDRPGIREDLAEMEGMLTAIDDAVGQIMAALREADLLEESLVIFTTEHGIAFPRAKGCCFDGGIEAALICRYPGVFDGGDRFDALISNVDILPTILDLVPDAAAGDISGRSFLSLGTDREYLPRESVFAEMTWHDRYNPVRAIRTARYKFIRNFWHLPEVYLTNDIFVSKAGREVREAYHSGHRDYRQLFDLEADPAERENLADEPAYEPVAAELDRQLLEWMERTDDPLLDGPVPPGDYGEIVPWGTPPR